MENSMKRGIGGPGRLLSFLGLCVLVLIVISGLACQKKSPTSTETSAPKSPAAAKPSTEPNAPKPVAVEPQIDKTVATVNGKIIGESELSTRVATTMRQLGGKLASLPPQYVAQVQKQLRTQSLEALVTERLLDEQVAATKINITDEDVNAEITKTGAQQNPPITVADFKARVEAQGGNFDQVKNEFRKGMSYRKLMETQWGDKIKVSDDEAKQYYDSHTKEFETPEEVRASHILALSQPKDPNADPNQVKAAAKAKAEKLLKQVKDGGDFAAIAKENSEDPGSASDGGDLGFFPRGKMVKSFEDAAFAMKPGETSDIIETSYGYHIIKVTEHKDASTPPLEEVKAGIVERLAGEKRNPITKQYIQSLRDKAKIVYAEGEGPAPAAPATAPKPSTASQPAVTVSPAGQPAPSSPAPVPAPEPNKAKP
jgi:peptidyl-prolyl cis-trans isomerase C